MNLLHYKPLSLTLLLSAAALSVAAEPVNRKALANYTKLPLAFEENRGQAGSRVRFLSRGDGYAIQLSASDIVLKLKDRAVRMRFAGASSPALSGVDRQAAISSYFVGNDPSKWLTGIPNYSRVRYTGLYPGVDMVLYGNQRQLEYDFVVAPGAHPEAVQLEFDGVAGMRTDDNGDLVLSTPAGEMREHKPVIYQESHGERRVIDGHYVIYPNRRVGFQIAAYNVHQPLVIDPTLTYLTYLGSPGFERFDAVQGTYPAVAVDFQGNAYVTGFNGGNSMDFPGPPQILSASSGGGGFEVFVSKFNPSGNALLYSVVFGGGMTDVGGAIAVDGSGNAYVTGFTSSNNFPTTAGAPQTSLHGSINAFVTKVNAAGTALVYSTYIGGTGSDWGRGIAVDRSGNAYVAGQAQESGGTNFPLVNALDNSPGPGFLTKVNASGTGFAYSTFLAAGTAYAVAVDSNGNAFVTGTEGNNGGNGSAFVIDVNAGGNGLNYGPVAIGSAGAQNTGYGIAVDSQSNAYVTGMTGDPAFPVTNGAQRAFGGGNTDAFALKLNSGGSIVWSTYLGGIGTNPFPERGSGIGIDLGGNAYVAGTTECIGFPKSNQIAGAQGSSAPLLQSTDHGSIWSSVGGLSPASNGLGSFDQVRAVAFDPTNPATTFYVAVGGGNGAGVYKTTSGGSGWTYENNGLPANTVDSIAVDPANGQILYAVVSGGHMYQSSNGGASWSGLSQTIGTSGTIAINRATPTTLYAGSSTGLITSTNSGSSWSPVGTVPAPVTALVTDAGGNYYAGTHSGVYKNGAATNNGLSNLTVTGLAVGPTGIVYAATAGGLFQLPSGGSTWSAVPITSTAGTPYLVAVDPSNSSDLYVALLGSGVVISTNGGATWSQLTYSGLTRNQILSLAVQPTTGDIFAGAQAPTDAFVAKISADGSTLVYSTCIGGSDNDLGQSVAVTPTGTAYVSGVTVSTNLPVQNAYQQTLAGSYDAFAGRIDAPSSGGPPSVDIDTPKSGTALPGTGTITVSGWAIDNTSMVGTAISRVAVYVDGYFVGNATYGGSRPDVCSAFPGRPGCPNVGYTFSFDASTVPSGAHNITVYAADSDAPAPDVGLVSVNVTIGSSSGAPGPPTVHIDAPGSGATISGTVTVSGWALDNASAVGTAINPSSVLVRVDGNVVGTATYGTNRADVCKSLPGRPGCPNVGYTFQLNTSALSAGAHTISVSATDTDANPDTGSASVSVTVGSGGGKLPGPPSVDIDTPKSGATISGTVTVSGWALDNSSGIGTAISQVQVEVDGRVIGPAQYGTPRQDVCNALPGRPGCPNVGYTFQLNTSSLAPGAHTITVTATDSDNPGDTGSVSVNVTVGAGSIGPPSVNIDKPTSGSTISGTVTVAGWALDNSSAIGTAINANSVVVKVDGNIVGNATYGTPRSDVCNALPGRPGCPNVGFTFQLNTATLAAGSHTITVSATDTDSPTPDTGSASSTVTVQ